MRTSDDEMLPSTRNTFRNSSNPHFNQFADDEQGREARYEPDQIFVGWNLGGREEFEDLAGKMKRRLVLNEDVSNPRKARNQAIQLAIEYFDQVVGERKEPVFIDRSEPDVAFYGGQRGSGKSFNLRALSNRSAKAGVTNIVIDPEHEYVTNNMYNGIQSGLENLRPREKPDTVETKVLMPHFVWKARDEAHLPERGYDHVEVFKFEFSDLDPNDIHFVMVRKFDDHPDFWRFASELEERLSRGEQLRSWRDIYRVAEELDEREEFSWTGKKRSQQIRRFLESQYEKWGFLGPDKKIGRHSSTEYNNLGELLQQYNTVVLSLHDEGRLPDELYMKELYVEFLIKRVRNLVERGVVSGPIDWVIDESHEYVPANTEPDHPPSKRQIRRLIKKDRKRGMRLTFGSQEPTDMQTKNFLNQADHYFIPWNMKPRPRRSLLSLAQVTSNEDRGRGKWEAVFDAMFKHQWLYCDARSKDWLILEPASPLANHLQSES